MYTSFFKYEKPIPESFSSLQVKLAAHAAKLFKIKVQNIYTHTAEYITEAERIAPNRRLHAVQTLVARLRAAGR